MVYVIVIAWGQGFMAVNQPSPEGAARGRGWFTLRRHFAHENIIFSLVLYKETRENMMFLPKGGNMTVIPPLFSW